MILLKINTVLLDKFSPILTLLIVVGMVIVAGRFLWSKSVSGSIASLGVCGLLLWAVNSLSSFMSFVSSVVSFATTIFNA